MKFIYFIKTIKNSLNFHWQKKIISISKIQNRNSSRHAIGSSLTMNEVTIITICFLISTIHMQIVSRMFFFSFSLKSICLLGNRIKKKKNIHHVGSIKIKELLYVMYPNILSEDELHSMKNCNNYAYIYNLS